MKVVFYNSNPFLYFVLPTIRSAIHSMFAVREREINKEFEAIESGHHPKFEAIHTALLAQRDKRLHLANAWLRYGKERAKNLQEGMVEQASDDFKVRGGEGKEKNKA